MCKIDTLGYVPFATYHPWYSYLAHHRAQSFVTFFGGIYVHNTLVSVWTREPMSVPFATYARGTLPALPTVASPL